MALPIAAAKAIGGARGKRAPSEARPASGLVLTILGVWLIAQALGGNLAGRLRSASGFGARDQSGGRVNPLASDEAIAESIALQVKIKELMRGGLPFDEAFDEARR